MFDFVIIYACKCLKAVPLLIHFIVYKHLLNYELNTKPNLPFHNFGKLSLAYLNTYS